MMHLLGLALRLLHFIITDFQLRYEALISLRSHSFLAVREGSGLPVSVLLGKELGEHAVQLSWLGKHQTHSVGTCT